MFQTRSSQHSVVESIEIIDFSLTFKNAFPTIFPKQSFFAFGSGKRTPQINRLIRFGLFSVLLIKFNFQC